MAAGRPGSWTARSEQLFVFPVQIAHRGEPATDPRSPSRGGGSPRGIRRHPPGTHRRHEGTVGDGRQGAYRGARLRNRIEQTSTRTRSGDPSDDAAWKRHSDRAHRQRLGDQPVGGSHAQLSGRRGAGLRNGDSGLSDSTGVCVYRLVGAGSMAGIPAAPS